MKQILIIVISLIAAGIIPNTVFAEGTHGVPSHEPAPMSAPAQNLSPDIMRAVEKRSRELDAREEKIKTEEERLNALRLEIDAKITEMTKAREKIEKLIESARVQDDREIENLAKIYETMPAEEAASRIEKLDNKLAVQLLKAMKNKTAGRILSFVEPAKAAKLTQEMGRRIAVGQGL